MAGPLRIEFKGALYHILSKGNEYRDVFLGVLEEMSDRYFLRGTGLYTNKQIGEFFGLTYSAVSHRASIVESEISKQSEMRRKYSLIKSIIKV